MSRFGKYVPVGPRPPLVRLLGIEEDSEAFPHPVLGACEGAPDPGALVETCTKRGGGGQGEGGRESKTQGEGKRAGGRLLTFLLGLKHTHKGPEAKIVNPRPFLSALKRFQRL